MLSPVADHDEIQRLLTTLALSDDPANQETIRALLATLEAGDAMAEPPAPAPAATDSDPKPLLLGVAERVLREMSAKGDDPAKHLLDQWTAAKERGDDETFWEMT